MSVHTLRRSAAPALALRRIAALLLERSVALTAGLIFAAGALAILLEDVVLAGTPFALKHALTCVTFSGTLLVGHMLIDAARKHHVLAALGFTLVFVVGTAMLVYSSTGRQAEHTFESQAQADDVAAQRLDVKSKLARAEAMLAEAQADLARECKTGRGKRCDGIAATIGVYDAAVRGHKSDLDRLGPARPVEPEAEQFARVAEVFGFDKARVRAAALLAVPFVRTILFELGGLWCLGYACRPVQRASRIGSSDTDLAAFAALVMPDAPAKPSGGVKPDSPTPRAPKAPDAPAGLRERMLAHINTELALGQTIPRQADLIELFGVPRSTVSDWLREWEAGGSIPARRTIGRCKQLSARINA